MAPPPAGQHGTVIQDRARDQDRDQDRDRLMDDGQVMYGWQLMTPAERNAYRTQMRGLRTEREREALRIQHHQQMQERADMPARGGNRPTEPPGG